MAKTESRQTEIVLLEADVQNQIFQIRGLNVMPARDLAAIYAVETKQLKRWARRNIERFLGNFVFDRRRTPDFNEPTWHVKTGKRLK